MIKMRLVVSVLALAAVMLWAVGCGGPPAQSGFNLIFRYGVGAKNELDTFAGTYTKDMVDKPSLTIDLSLSQDEMDKIRQKMKDIGFFDYPGEFSVTIPPGQPMSAVTPHSTYYFKVQDNGKTKELRWEDQIVYRDEKSEKLKELINLIRGIIEAKDGYKKLPQPTSGYL